jgi:GT2 family glycosyltransferase
VREYASPFARLELVENPKRITVGGLNAGMDAARGDCWIIIGAHSSVRPDFVRESVEALKRTGAACVGGPIETLGEGTMGKAIAAAMSSPFGVGNAKFRYAAEEGEVDTVPFGCYHRRVWEVVGRFDETVDGADEDSYNARLIEAGGRIVLVPAIRSSYFPRRTFKALAAQYGNTAPRRARSSREGAAAARHSRPRRWWRRAGTLADGPRAPPGAVCIAVARCHVRRGRDGDGLARLEEPGRELRAHVRGDGDHARHLRRGLHRRLVAGATRFTVPPMTVACFM